MSIRVEVDRDICEGNEVCVGLAPAVFRLRDDADIVDVLQESPGADLEEAVRESARRCPRAAITVHED